MRKLSLLLFTITLLLAAGCSAQNSTQNPTENSNSQSKTITKIQITCTAECKNMYPDQQEVQTFEDEETIQIFTTPIQNAVKMPGEMDYSILYEMLLTYEDNTTDLYYLNVEKQKDHIGFLVHTAESGIGYSIPNEYKDKIRELLYK